MRQLLPILLVSSFISFGCAPSLRAADPGTTPAPTADFEPTQAAAEAPAPAHHHDTGQGKTLAAGTIESLAACWFERPYEYMFDRSSSVMVGDKSFGMLQAGIRGILYYGRLNDCAGRLTGRPPRSYSDPSPFAALSGLPVIVRPEGDGVPFDFYDPRVLIWARDNLLPDPAMPILGTPAQRIYDGVFSRFFRLMAEAYVFLAAQGAYQSQMAAYMEAVVEQGSDGLDWLDGSYSGVLSNYGDMSDGTSMTPPMAIGFWLRRGVDGTSDDLWLGLREVMRRFDGEWYGRLAQTHHWQGVSW